MKKIMILITALTIGSSAFAQEHNMEKMEPNKDRANPMPDKMDGQDGMKKDHIMMMDGKMMMMKNGKEMPMDKDITMGNGTVAMTDGMCKKTDGSTMMMIEGDVMYMDGKMGKMPKMGKENKMGKMKM